MFARKTRKKVKTTIVNRQEGRIKIKKELRVLFQPNEEQGIDLLKEDYGKVVKTMRVTLKEIKEYNNFNEAPKT